MYIYLIYIHAYIHVFPHTYSKYKANFELEWQGLLCSHILHVHMYCNRATFEKYTSEDNTTNNCK